SIGETNLCRVVAALALGVPVRVADDPRVSVYVLVYLRPELVVGRGPMRYDPANAIAAAKHLGYVERGLHVTKLHFDVRVIQLEQGVPVAHVQQFGAATEPLHVLRRHPRPVLRRQCGCSSPIRFPQSWLSSLWFAKPLLGSGTGWRPLRPVLSEPRSRASV